MNNMDEQYSKIINDISIKLLKQKTINDNKSNLE